MTTSGGPTPVPLNEASAEKITRTLTARSEWLGFVAQSAAISTSLIVDKLPDPEKVLLSALLIIHLTLALRTRAKGRGPFTSGPPWGATWLACCALVPVVMALLVPPGDYGSAAQCVQMCAYPIGPVTMFAFFPWGLSGRRWRRLPVQILTMVGLALEPLLVILLINGSITETNIKSVIFSALIVVLAFLAGLEVKRICTNSAQLHFTGLEDEYRRQHRTIHDRVRTAITAAREATRTGRYEAVVSTLEDLSREIDNEEYRLSTATEDVNVLRVLRRLRDRYPNRVRLDAPTGTGNLPQPVGELIGRCVENLVDNAVKYGGPSTLVRFQVDESRGIAMLSVVDDGAGFDPRQFDSEGTTLHDLRRDVRARGGDLLVQGGRRHNEVLLFVSTLEPR